MYKKIFSVSVTLGGVILFFSLSSWSSFVYAGGASSKPARAEASADAGEGMEEYRQDDAINLFFKNALMRNGKQGVSPAGYSQAAKIAYVNLNTVLGEFYTMDASFDIKQLPDVFTAVTAQMNGILDKKPLDDSGIQVALTDLELATAKDTGLDEIKIKKYKYR